MKRILALFLLMTMVLSLCACGSGAGTVNPDYEDVASFESALNAGEDVTGKTVRFSVDGFVPDSAFGYNMQTGEHLNFCSTKDPKVSVGDSVTVKVVDVSSMLGSWIISYEKVG